MSLGSLVGFGVLAVLLMIVFSLASASIVALAGTSLRRAGAAAERRAAAGALVAPVLLALSIVVVLAVHGSGGGDHCLGHRHHAHLCFVHGAEWLERPWAVALAVGGSITMLLRLTVVIVHGARTKLAIAQVRRVAQLDGEVRIAPSERSFCFVAGWRRPEVYVSSRAWEVLSPTERDAVISHERAHVAHGDLWWRLVIDVAAVFSAPLVGSVLRARWSDASERLCDARAAERTDRATVASALVQLARAGMPQHLPSGFTPADDRLAGRVTAVLDGGPTGEDAARRLAIGAAGVAVSLVVVAAVFATELHHALETLLG